MAVAFPQFTGAGKHQGIGGLNFREDRFEVVMLAALAALRPGLLRTLPAVVAERDLPVDEVDGAGGRAPRPRSLQDGLHGPIQGSPLAISAQNRYHLFGHISSG